MEDSSPAAKQSLKPRRFLRFSLRALMLAIGVLSVWLAIQVNKAQKQRAAVAAIREADGAVLYDWMLEHQNSRYQTGKAFIPWEALDEWQRYRPRTTLGALFGDDYFGRVVAVHLDGKHCLDALTRLPDVTQLTLDNATLTDSDLEQIARLSSLDTLNLSGPTITDRNVEVLKQMKQLTILAFVDTNVTEAGADRLRAVLPDCHVSVYVNPRPANDEPLQRPVYELLPLAPQAAGPNDRTT